MGIAARVPAVQQAALGAEVAQRRVVARAGIAVALIVTGPALAVLLSDPVRHGRGEETLAFAVTAWSLAVVLAGTGVAAYEVTRARYLDAVLRYFGGAGRAPSLVDLARDARWEPPDVFNDEAGLMATITTLCGAAIFTTYLAVHAHDALLVLAAVALVSVVGVAVGRLLWNASGKGETTLEALADGVQALRERSTVSVRLNDEEVIRVDGEGEDLRLRVKPLPKLPGPEYTARAYFGPDGYEDEGTQAPWRVYREKPVDEASGLATGFADLPLSAPRPLAARLGPLAAALLAALGALLLTVSVVQGAPGVLPGWALHGPFLYEAARAGLALAALVVLANLLLALASGRLVSKVSSEGLELAADAASTQDVAEADRAAARTLADHEARLGRAEAALHFLPSLIERSGD